MNLKHLIVLQSKEEERIQKIDGNRSKGYRNQVSTGQTWVNLSNKTNNDSNGL